MKSNNIRLLLFLSALLLAAASPQTALAQRGKKANATSSSPSSQPSQTSAEKLIQDYRFEQAAQWLQRELTAAKRGNKNTERLEAELQRANLGQDMLRGTEKVLFVDSFTVARDHLVQTIKLSREAGTLVNLTDIRNQLSYTPTELGNAGYINELNDRLIFSATDTLGQAKRLWTSYRTGADWGAPTPLPGLDTDEADRDYPFMMADGNTLYFAAQSEESLGGYDIFVTRYDATSHRFLKPENVGMPFNSPANDYLMGIDETTGLGFFVTDRRQPADSVCVYIFQPSSTRETYELTADNEEEVKNAAQILSIAQSQTDAEALKEARLRMQRADVSGKQSNKSRYVISDHTVYTSLQEFHSDAARRIAQQADEVKDELEKLLQAYRKLQLQVSLNKGRRSASTNEEAKQMTLRIPELRKSIQTLERNMRKAELSVTSPH